MLSGCVPAQPVQTIDDDWASPLDGDLRSAVTQLQTAFSQEGWHVQIKWAGVRGSSYNIERGPTGEPLRESIPVLYAFAYPARNKCYLSPESSSNEWEVRLAREHLGGGRYGPPQIMGLGSLNGDGDPTGPEVVCSAVDQAKGGVHVGAGAEAASTTSTVASTPSTSTPPSNPAQAYDPQDALAKLAPSLPPACAEYARVTCTNPRLPAGTDRKYFCEHLVAQTNVNAAKPGAEKTCKVMLKNMDHPR